MSDIGNLSYLAGLAVSAGLVVWGLMEIFKGRQAGESGSDQISRQIRGAALLLVASMILAFAGQLSSGSLNIADLIRSSRP